MNEFAEVEDHVVFDVEIARTIDQVGGWDATDKMGIGYAVTYEYKYDRFRVFGPTEGEAEALQKRLLEADRISGYNIWNFDFPVVWGLSKSEWKQHELKKILRPKTNDVLRRIWGALGRFSKGWKLDDVGGNTIGARKIGNGADAPVWFQNGEHARVITYCIDDVAIERDLAKHVDDHGFVINGKQRLELPPWSGA